MVVTKCDILKSRGTYPSALESDLVSRTHLLEFSFVWKYKQYQTITTRYILMHKNANQGTAKVSLINNSSMVYVHVCIYIYVYIHNHTYTYIICLLSFSSLYARKTPTQKNQQNGAHMEAHLVCTYATILTILCECVTV
jgi:hypothetical protein